MRSGLINLTYEIEIQSGEKLTLPETIINSVGAGRWIVTIQPLAPATILTPVRRHSAFLSGYAPEDEGLYDDHPTR